MANPSMPLRGLSEFAELVNEAIATKGIKATTVKLDLLIDYAAEPSQMLGNLLQADLLKNDWLFDRLVALIKAKRRCNSLGANILAADKPVDVAQFGFEVDDPLQRETVLERLLESVD